ncbi:MAG: 5-bromo-4-chloroindolyl phosphate hydrolysis family protein [Coriobacteriales bacterium]
MASPKNFGEQIQDAVQDAVGSQDFSKLQQTIEQSINVAAANIGKGIAQAQESYRQAQAEAAAKAAADQQAPIPPSADMGSRTRERHLDSQRRAQQRAAERSQRAIVAQKENALYARTGGRLGVSITMIVFGAIFTLVFTPIALSLLAFGDFFSAAILGVFAVAGAGTLASGILKTIFLSHFKKYRNVIGLRDYCYIRDIASVTGESQSKVLARLKKMLRKGLFQQAALDDEQTMIIMTSECFEQYRQAQQLELKRKRQERIADSVTQDQEPAVLNADQKALLARGEAYIAKIRLSNEAIPGEEISRKIDQIEDVVRIIFKRAAEQPQVIADLGQLMDYYLPTTVKLLDAYRELDAQPIQGDNIVQSKREIEGALDSLATAFEKLLDSIFRDMAWDVSSDVSVLHTVLAQEGLVDSPFATQEKLA